MASYQGRRSTYDLTVDNVKHIFHAQASGFFDEADGTSFLKDYTEITSKFPKDTYTLIIDAPRLLPSSPDVAQMLGVLLQKYMDVPFKKRFLITEGNTITMIQFKRLGSSIPGWTESVQYVDTLEEALNK